MSTAVPPALEADSPFHAGEAALQQRAGVRDRIEQVGRRIVRDHMPEQHRELFAKLPTLLVGSLDGARRPWASILVGRPGFISAPDARHLRIAAAPGHGDPLGANLATGVPLGLLGIEPHTRRRNRMNGTVVALDAHGFEVEVDQSFGNCPQYIQARAPRWVAEPATFALARPLVEEGRVLGPQAQTLVARSDTFYVASAAPQARGHGGADGVDVSHRGGRPGFVRHDVDGAGAQAHSVLTIPDFRGNDLYATLGNLAAWPHAGLLFVDHDSGDLLQLTGRAEIVWDGAEVEAYAGARRLWRVRVEVARRMPGALPLRWSAPAYAPQLGATGAWPA
jgi:predicted pyridoxine 5'-phosphate oxidase superfamily flavin-nucleotide-binding protein